MNNIFLKACLSLGKVIVSALLSYLFLIYIFLSRGDMVQIGIGLFILIFITLPTMYLFFLKKKWTKLAGFWKIYRFFYVFFIIFYVAVTAFGMWHLNELAKTRAKVEFINSQKITMDDVTGKNLPPKPDQKLNDSTIGGIDANKNFIRDDVELAIFQKHPDSTKIRAAELQYAQALQLELTQVDSSATLIPVLQKESYAVDCIGKTGPQPASLDGLKIINDRKKEVDSLVLNIDLRKKQDLNILNKYMIGYASLPGNKCDLEIL